MARAVRPIDRRTFLVTGGLALAGLATACTKKHGGLPARGTMKTLVDAAKKDDREISVIQAVGSILVRTSSRVSFALTDKAGTNRYTGGHVQVYWAPVEGNAVAKGPVDAVYHGEGLGDKGVYVARIDVDKAGDWNVLVVGKPGGATTDVWGGAAYPAVDHVQGPGPGAKAIAVATPTVDNHRGVNPYCTATPPCSMHAVSLDVALANGRPTVFVIGTPRFCQSRVCGPVVDIIQGVSTDFADRVNFIHAEVYKDDRDAPSNPVTGLSPTAKAWSLEEEPVTYWIKPDNTITERIVGPTDTTEVRAITQALLG
jgi:hypothetical protein